MSLLVSPPTPARALGPKVTAAQAEFAEALLFVIEPDAGYRLRLVEALAAGGFCRVVPVEGAATALALLEKEAPALIITGEAMPGAESWEVCKQIKADPRFSHVPVVAGSGLVEPIRPTSRCFSCQGSAEVLQERRLAGLVERARMVLEQNRLLGQLDEYRRRMLQELELAREMQRALLPSQAKLSSFEARLPVQIASHYRASMGLGGDLWGMSERYGRRLGFYMADFVGHGVAAALNTFRLHSFLQTPALAVMALAEIIPSMNAFLASTLSVGQFATLIAGRIDFAESALEFCPAGGPPPLLRVGATGPFELMPSSGLPLGIDRWQQHPVRNYPFPPGSMLLFYSDALTDTPLSPHAVFSSESLAVFANRLPPETTAQGMIDALLARLEPFVPDDDLTLVAIHHCGAA